MSTQEPCPRLAYTDPAIHARVDTSHIPDDGTCHGCGSLLGDLFMARVEAGDVTLGPTDKPYKVYVHNSGGAAFPRVHSGSKDPDGHWTWKRDETDMCKFYFQHLTEEQKKRFVDLLNDKKIKLGDPGYFYVLPFFCVPLSKDEA